MLASATRPRRSKLTNVVVRQSKRTWTSSSGAISVQVFDLIGRTVYREPFSPIPSQARHQTFQNVFSYYDVRFVVRSRWRACTDSTGASIAVEACSAVLTTTVGRWQGALGDRSADDARPRRS